MSQAQKRVQGWIAFSSFHVTDHLLRQTCFGCERGHGQLGALSLLFEQFSYLRANNGSLFGFLHLLTLSFDSMDKAPNYS